MVAAVVVAAEAVLPSIALMLPIPCIVAVFVSAVLPTTHIIAMAHALVVPAQVALSEETSAMQSKFL